MSDTFEKAANLTPGEMFALSLLGGAGGYAGLQTLQRTMDRINSHKPKKNTVQLNLQDPAAIDALSTSSPQTGMDGGVAIPQIGKAAEDSVDPYSWSQWGLLRPMAVAAGLPLGFIGAKSLYDRYQLHENQKEIDDAKHQYEKALRAAQAANTKLACETPAVDGFCEELSKTAGLAQTLAKLKTLYAGLSPFQKNLATTAGIGGAGLTASLAAPPIIHHGGNALWQTAPGLFGMQPSLDPHLSTHELASRAAASPEMQREAQNRIADTSTSGIKRLANFASLGAAPQAANTLAALGLGVGALGLGYGIHSYHKKKEKEQKAQYPTTVSYAE